LAYILPIDLSNLGLTRRACASSLLFGDSPQIVASGCFLLDREWADLVGVYRYKVIGVGSFGFANMEGEPFLEHPPKSTGAQERKIYVLMAYALATRGRRLSQIVSNHPGRTQVK
jgi:hypothetical protein